MVSSTKQAKSGKREGGSKPISGEKGVEVNIPSNKYVVLTGYVQSAAGQSVQVKNSNGEVTATIKGDGDPAKMSTAAFTSDGNGYTVHFFNSGDGGFDSKVIYNHMDISDGATKFAETWTFLTEDDPNSTRDYNDSTVQLTWTAESN